jgi:hypothetical protein
VRYIDGNPDHPINKGVICAKGSAGIMKQVSPARLTQPLLRKAGSERGAGEFEPISWERAFEILTERLGHLRATDPKKFAMFTGRDQMQALTGPVRAPVRHPNYAAHGGFCSVNMAAGHDLHRGRQLLGIRRTGPGPREAVRDDRHGRGPPQQPDEDRRSASSSARAAASSRSTRCAPATRPSPTNGSRSGPAPTARCSWRCCTN